MVLPASLRKLLKQPRQNDFDPHISVRHIGTPVADFKSPDVQFLRRAVFNCERFLIAPFLALSPTGLLVALNSKHPGPAGVL